MHYKFILTAYVRKTKSTAFRVIKVFAIILFLTTFFIVYNYFARFFILILVSSLRLKFFEIIYFFGFSSFYSQFPNLLYYFLLVFFSSIFSSKFFNFLSKLLFYFFNLFILCLLNFTCISLGCSLVWFFSWYYSE